MEQAFVKCPDCGSHNIVKTGFVVVKPGDKKQRYKCSDCGRTFYPEEDEG